ncbi:hypothetical protein GCM10011613_01040 [Cellvibrio zantedeschiae]|uniref:Transposase n=1 Tax=Cellvibrio zantedeschiae TaxID=1237077 RepID=A0ABQ3AM05_9GAMM|nr:hypothetical protein [Cellvibrio zantedeschiae]GGY61438.1 hypothetical protein GCM10011613_01040 [Cellvibrio zantedeschiae]
MGADAFVGFYGIKIELDPDDEDELDACGEETDPRCVKAKQAGLECHSGNMTDGEDYFLFIGKNLAWLGLEHDQYISYSPDSFNAIVERVNSQLKNAGFTETPALHFQFVGQY